MSSNYSISGFSHPISEYSDDREIVRQSAMEAIGIMAKTSKESRNYLFPSLMRCLNQLPDYALGTIAQGTRGIYGTWKRALIRSPYT